MTGTNDMKKHSGAKRGGAKAGATVKPHIGGLPTAGRDLPISGGVIKKGEKAGSNRKSTPGAGVGFKDKHAHKNLGFGTDHAAKHQNVGFKGKAKKK